MLIVAGVMALVVVLIAAIAGGSALALRQRTTAQAPTPPPATPTVTPIMPGWSGYNPLVNDPLTGYASDWPDDTHCFVRTDGYHIKDGYFCYPGGSDVGDATTSVRAELFAGPLDMLYGIAFRIVNQPNHFAFYFFGVSADGDWTFGRQEGDTWIPIVALQPSAAIQVGPHVFTTLTVNATGSHFVFYVGRTQIGSADDPKLAEGYSGLTIYGNGEAVFTNFLVGV